MRKALCALCLSGYGFSVTLLQRQLARKRAVKSNIDEVTRGLRRVVRWGWGLEERPRRGKDTGFGLGLNLEKV